jgi:NADH-quinone oxidoreductase subunit C
VNERIVQQLRQFAPDAIGAVEEYRGDLTVTVRKQEIVRICEFLKADPALAFDMLIDLLGVDMYRPEGRFEVVYNLYSIANKTYLRLKVSVEEDDPVVPTLTGVWPAANWHERETYDMFGIKFAGHPDLRRFYMPEEFEYYPLRKDFPLMGIPDSLTLPRR